MLTAELRRVTRGGTRVAQAPATAATRATTNNTILTRRAMSGDSSTGSGFDQPVADGVAHDLADRAGAQLPHDVRAVRFRGLDADAERSRRLAGTAPLGQEPHDLTLALGEGPAGLRHAVPGRPPIVALDDQGSHAGREERLLAQERRHRRCELMPGIRLQD